MVHTTAYYDSSESRSRSPIAIVEEETSPSRPRRALGRKTSYHRLRPTVKQERPNRWPPLPEDILPPPYSGSYYPSSQQRVRQSPVRSPGINRLETDPPRLYNADNPEYGKDKGISVHQDLGQGDADDHMAWDGYHRGCNWDYERGEGERPHQDLGQDHQDD